MNSSRRSFLAGIAAAGAAYPAAKETNTKLAVATLGRTGLKVTRLGFGCMITSDPSVIERAVDAGINYFDTARVYGSGNNERMVGAALKAHRKNVILSTKALPRDPKAALDTLDKSLSELGTDYVDIWYLHSITNPAELTDDLIEAQRKAKAAGKIRFAGMTLHINHAQVIPEVIRKNAWDAMMVTYNYALDRSIEPLIKQAADKGIGTVAMKVMAGSLKIPGTYDPAFQARMKQREGAPEAALKWAMRVPFIHTSVPSMVDADQLQENIQAMAAPFRPEDEKVLAAHLDLYGPFYCRMCGSCSGACAQGLPVSEIVRYAHYADGYGQFPLARENYLGLPAHLQSVRCGDCAGCTVKCPNGVRVRDRVSRAQAILS